MADIPEQDINPLEESKIAEKARYRAADAIQLVINWFETQKPDITPEQLLHATVDTVPDLTTSRVYVSFSVADKEYTFWVNVEETTIEPIPHR
ncbi:hypothetical protein LRY65_05830 [Candidatus Woesebacteria bacterium]|nr:hypothetical protein [Candidatus Woesebacteria bacterium]MCD8506772.1 hypothetical protein [Candidatus Woesebacteria bacterium]MCD8527681.1 hypothetical protein [Candidatus Woesebacteria bacterium]MCD8546350.1 hypothetical protein [Candidatus Woesebacteria bacterium]